MVGGHHYVTSSASPPPCDHFPAPKPAHVHDALSLCESVWQQSCGYFIDLCSLGQFPSVRERFFVSFSFLVGAGGRGVVCVCCVVC